MFSLNHNHNNQLHSYFYKSHSNIMYRVDVNKTHVIWLSNFLLFYVVFSTHFAKH